jgi:hypothetical protein
MKFTRTSPGTNAALELRILELEDTVAALARITGTIVEMTGKLNEIADHYVTTLAGLMIAIPQEAAYRALPLLASSHRSFGAAGGGGDGHNGPVQTPGSGTCCGAKGCCLPSDD